MATTETETMTTAQAEAAAADAILEAAAKPKAKPRGRAKAKAQPKAAAKAPATKSGVSGRDAVAKVLADGQPRKTAEITSAAVKLVRPPMTGKTPEATLSALLYTQAKRDDGLVILTGKGEFKLRPQA